MCIDTIGPREEVCNEADDDCNGIVDDVGGGNSAESTRCGCYGDATPKSETCNGIDDDCDGYVDNGIACCSRGETRSCGISIGICKAGVSKCIEGGWGPCTGIISPLPEEICYNNLDDNCNGEIDEGCTGQSTCFNQMKDLNEEGIDCGGSCVKKCIQPGLFIIIAIFAIIIIILFIILQVRGLSTKTRGAERTLSEEMGE